MRLALALCMQADDRRTLFGQTLALLPKVPPDECGLVKAAIMALAEPQLTDDELDQLIEELTKVSKILERVEQKNLQKGEQIGIQKVAKALLAAGDSVEKVMTITGLTRAEVAALQAR